MTQSDELLRSVEESLQSESHNLDALVEISVDDLYAAAGLRARNALVARAAQVINADELARGGQSRLAQLFDTKLVVDALSRNEDEKNLGKRIFRRWNRTLHDFACNANAEDRDLKDKLLSAISMKTGGGTAVVAAVLAGYFLVSPPLAAVLAALLIKLILVPAGQEVCQAWAGALNAGE
jgi:hypothetical protein